MAIVITNGEYYIKTNEYGKIIKTPSLDEAKRFYNVNTAVRKMQKAPGKTKGFYVFDTEGDEKPKAEKSDSRKRDRKKYSERERKMIYAKADGRCELCGQEISYKKMTLDHIVPLAMGGADELENLQCTCRTCNEFKGHILPADFMERIKEIYVFQMKKKYGEDIELLVVHKEK